MNTAKESAWALALIACGLLILVAGILAVTAGRDNGPAVYDLAVPPSGGEGGSGEQALACVIDDRSDAGETAELATKNKGRRTSVWRGKLFDARGTAVAGGEIKAVPADHDHPGKHDGRRARTDEAGRFEMGSINPGDYWISLRMHGQYINKWCRIRIPAEGVIEGDIHLEGGAIFGVVLYANTEAPLMTKPGIRQPVVKATGVQGRGKEIRARVIDGRFSLHDVGPGTYELAISGDGLAGARTTGIVVSEGQVVENVQLLVPRGGRLKLSFVHLGREVLDVLAQREGDEVPFYTKRLCHAALIDHKTDIGLPPGWWRLRISSERRGAIERRCEIRPGEVTELEVDIRELHKDESRVTLEGRITHADGRSAEAVVLKLRSINERAVSHGEAGRTGRTDEGGHYAVRDLEPGRWTVHVYDVRRNMLLGMPVEVSIPDTARGTYFKEIVLSSGSVAGTIVDTATSRPLARIDDGVEISLKDRSTDREICVIRRLKDEPRFEMTGLAPGLYDLQVRASGYEDHALDAITIREGEAIDLGAVRMRPAGAFTLRVSSAEGENIDDWRISFIGMNPGHQPRKLRGDKAWYIPVPGPVTVQVECDGCRGIEITVAVPSGEIREIPVLVRRRVLEL